MRIKAIALTAFVLLPFAVGAYACGSQRTAEAYSPLQVAQASDAARPARGPQEQTSVSTNPPPASVTQPTGATNQPPAVKQMNEEERKKVEKEGK